MRPSTAARQHGCAVHRYIPRNRGATLNTQKGARAYHYATRRATAVPPSCPSHTSRRHNMHESLHDMGRHTTTVIANTPDGERYQQLRREQHLCPALLFDASIPNLTNKCAFLGQVKINTNPLGQLVEGVNDQHRNTIGANTSEQRPYLSPIAPVLS